MSELLSEEQQRKLLLALSPLSDAIANDDDIDKALEDILRKVDLKREGLIREKLDSYIKTLQAFHVNTKADDKEYVAKLTELGIPQASAELAITRIRGTSPVSEGERFPEEAQQQKLRVILSSLADVIADDGDVYEALENILTKANSRKEEWAEGELDLYIKTLLECHINRAVEEKDYVAKLMERRVPEALAAQVVSRVREKVPPDIEFEISRRNFVRAVLLAQNNHWPLDKIKHLQELAIRQFAAEYRNLPGLKKLVEEWEISKTEVDRILGDVLEQPMAYTGVQFDGNTMRYPTLKEWIENAIESKW